MPPVLFAAAIAAAIPATATPIIGGLTIANLLGGILGTGAMMGLQMLLQPKQKGQTQQAQLTPKDSTPVRWRGYGRMRLAGPTVFLDAVFGVYSHEAFVHCEGPIDEYEQCWLSDTLTPIPPGWTVSYAGAYPWFLSVVIESHKGNPNQAASNGLKGAYADWSDDHRLRGLAYSVLLCALPPKPAKTFQKVYPNGRPELFVVARLLKVYDPRSSLTEWSRNPSLCIRDFLTNERVVRDAGGAALQRWRLLSPDRIDDDSFAAAADICDEQILLSDSTHEARYRLDGVYDVSEPPATTLKKLLATCDGELVWQPWNGRYGLKVGKWEEPDITLTDDDFLDTGEYQQGNGRLSRFNRLTWTFIDPLNKYQQGQGDPWNDAAAQAESGEVLTESLDLEWVGSHTQGRRLCKIFTARNNPRHLLIGAVAKLHALRLVGRRVLRVKLDILGIDQTFRITRVVPSGDLSTVTLDLASFSNPYAWDPLTEEGTRPPVTPTPAPGVVINPPQGLDLTVKRTVAQGEITVVRVRATVDPLSGQFADWHVLQGQIRPVGGTDDDYVDMHVDGDAAVISDFLDDGGEYQVRVRWAANGTESEWEGPMAITATSDPNAPNPPLIGNFFALGGAGQASLNWTNSNSRNYRATRVYRGATSDFTLATLVATLQGGPSLAMDWTDTSLAAGTYRYWIVAVNGSGVGSSETGPRTVTVT